VLHVWIPEETTWQHLLMPCAAPALPLSWLPPCAAVILVLRDIQPGEEITLSYIGQPCPPACPLEIERTPCQANPLCCMRMPCLALGLGSSSGLPCSACLLRLTSTPTPPACSLGCCRRGGSPGGAAGAAGRLRLCLRLRQVRRGGAGGGTGGHVIGICLCSNCKRNCKDSHVLNSSGG
jgi:hypothetical protein